jgi:hypothetical protein
MAIINRAYLNSVINWLSCLPHQCVPDCPLNYDCCKVVQSRSTKVDLISPGEFFFELNIRALLWFPLFTIFVTCFYIYEQHSY